MPTSYLNTLGSSIIHTECFSKPDKYKRVTPTPGTFPGVNYVHKYHDISTCRNGGSRDTAIAHSRRLLNLDYSGTSNDQYETLVTEDHMANVVHVANTLRSTGTKLVLISASAITAGHEQNGSERYSQPHYLTNDEKNTEALLLQALSWVLDNHSRYNIKVVNLSQAIVSQQYPDFAPYCDNNLPGQSYEFVKDFVDAFSARGIAFVGGAGNGPGGGGGFINDRLTFPGCLSKAITVGAIDLNNFSFYGHTSVYSDFFHHPSVSGYNGQPVRGTSYTAPRISSYISGLLNTNPSKSLNNVLDALRNTNPQYRRIAWTVGSTTYIKEPIYYPDYIAARHSILNDGVFGEIINMLASNNNSGQYGWNYGTRKHKNGVQIAVNTSSFGATATASSGALSRESSDQTTLQPVALDGAVAQATSTKTYYRFSLQGYDVDSVNELKVYVNDRFYGHVLPTGNGSTGSRQYFYIEASHLNANQTTFIKVVQSNSGERYGITNIQLARQSLSLINTSKTGSRIALSGTTNSTAYGYNGAGTYYSQLKSKYYYNGQDGLQLSLRAFDLEQNNELAIYINNQFFAYVSATGNNTYGNKTINIPHHKLSAGQWNNIDFRKFVRSDHAWVIDRLKATNLGPIVINMSVGQTINGMYGYLSSGAVQRRRVQVNFSATNVKDLKLTFATQHISANSLIITLNSIRIYPNGNKLELEKTLLRNGTNTLLFIYNGTSLWGVGNFNLKETSNIVPILQLLLLDE